MSRLILVLALALPGVRAAENAPAIKRFEQVDAHLYRGAQPTEKGFQSLARMGVKTVVDLRDSAAQSEREKNRVESLGMKFVSIPMRMRAPTDEQIAEVLHNLVTNSAGPVFVHCQGGRDRTGTVIACYRIAHDGWDNNKALREAMLHGLRPFFGMERYILNYKTATPVRPSQAQ